MRANEDRWNRERPASDPRLATLRTVRVTVARDPYSGANMYRTHGVRPVAVRSDNRPDPWIVGGLIGLLATVLLSLLFWRLSAEYHAYQNAPMCNTLPASADHSDCRYGLPATVTQVHVGSGRGATYWLTIQGDPPANGELHFTGEADVLDVVAIGETVHVEVWRGRVVRVDVYGHSDETSAAPRYGSARALGWLIAAAVTAVWLLSAGLGRRYGVQSRRWFLLVVQVGLGSATIVGFLAALFTMADPDLTYFWYLVGAVLVIPGAVVAGRRQYRDAVPARPISRRRLRAVLREPAVPAPPSRARRRGVWVSVCAAVLGLLAAVGAATALVHCVQTVAVVHAYRASTDCTNSAVGDCRQTATATVYEVRVVDGGGSSNWLNLEGAGAADGLVVFSGGTDFLRTIHAGDQVRVEIWRDQVTAVTAHGRVAGTAAAPAEDRDNAVGLLCVALLGAIVFLRWFARRRRRLLPWRAIGFPVVESAVLTAVVGGCVLLGFDVVWGAVPVALAIAILLYGAAVPTLWPRRAIDVTD